MTIFECLNKVCNFTKEYPNEDEPAICPDCGLRWYRVRFCGDKEPDDNSKGPGWNATMLGPERWSTSMGVPANQVEEFSKRFPNSKYSPDGRLQIKNRAHKKKLMKERGFIEHD